jgi:hypothetical protein
LQGEELVSQTDKRRSAALAAKFEVEQPTVKSQSLLNITDFQRYVVATNGARLFCFSYGCSPS